MAEQHLQKVIVKTKQPVQTYCFQNDILYISLKSSPTNNKANKELIKFLAKIFHTTQDQIIIVHGLTNSTKTIKIVGQ